MRKLIYFALICMGITFGAVFYYENLIWIGESCESAAQYICKRESGTRPKRFFSLNSCIEEYRNLGKAYLCVSGPNKNLPDNTAYSSFRNVYYSAEDTLKVRDVPYQFMLQILTAALGVVLLLTLGVVWLGVRLFRTRRKKRMVSIYMPLMDEGVDVWRSVDAIPLEGSNVYLIPISSIVPETETWAFQPGSVVQCEEKNFEGRTELVAVKMVRN